MCVYSAAVSRNIHRMWIVFFYFFVRSSSDSSRTVVLLADTCGSRANFPSAFSILVFILRSANVPLLSSERMPIFKQRTTGDNRLICYICMVNNFLELFKQKLYFYANVNYIYQYSINCLTWAPFQCGTSRFIMAYRSKLSFCPQLWLCIFYSYNIMAYWFEGQV